MREAATATATANRVASRESGAVHAQADRKVAAITCDKIMIVMCIVHEAFFIFQERGRRPGDTGAKENLAAKTCDELGVSRD